MKRIVILFFILYWPFNLVLAEENLIVKLEYNFANFYPHLGNSICRKDAFGIIVNEAIDNKEKIELWKKYKKTCSSDGSYQLILAGMYMGYGGHYREAIQVLEKNLDNSTYDSRYHKSLLHGSYYYLNEISKATNLAKKMIEDYPNWYAGFTCLGLDLMEVKDWNKAKEYLEKSLKLYDKDSATYLLLTAVSYELKEDDKVLGYYREALELDPLKPFLDWRSSAAVVGVYVLRGKFEEAKNIIDQQQKLLPEFAQDKRFNAVKDYYENALRKAKK